MMNSDGSYNVGWFVEIDYQISPDLVSLHSLQNLPSKLVLFLLLSTCQEACSLLWLHGQDLLFESLDESFSVLAFFVKELVVFDWLLKALRLKVLVEIFRVEQVHETHVNEVFQLPDPLSNEAQAELGTNAVAVTCHHQRQKASLRNIFLQRIRGNEVEEVLGNEGTCSYSVDASFCGVGLVNIALHCDAVSTSKDVWVAR
jgi:hypothetical protein